MKYAARQSGILITAVFLASGFAANTALAVAQQELDIKVRGALEEFRETIPGADEFLAKSKGVLVMPNVFRAGFILGMNYGNGALLINGKTADYYSLGGATLGFTFGAQARAMVIVFMEQQALDDFRSSNGWEAGLDGSIAIATLGAGSNVSTKTIKDAMIAFVFGNKGLMVNISIDGSKFEKIEPETGTQVAQDSTN